LRGAEFGGQRLERGVAAQLIGIRDLRQRQFEIAGEQVKSVADAP
jgi:hypothetical protein